MTRGSGGGYGGKGGDCAGSSGTAGGETYGSPCAPMDPGSGGGGQDARGAGAGGGAVRVEAGGRITINGTISADGQAPRPTAFAAGSGGAIFLVGNPVEGVANGLLSARGGNASPTGENGGGGRIAVWVRVPEDSRKQYESGSSAGVASLTSVQFSGFQGQTLVDGGTGYQSGDAGTAFFFLRRGTLYLFR